jgi:predicted RND superfamily exporter protein
LAKGIAFSLIAVMIFLPALILVSEKWIEKTKHRVVVRDVNKFARTMVKMQFIVLILVAVLAVPAFLAQGRADFTFGASKFFSSDTQVGQEKAMIEKSFGKSNQMVLLVPKGDLSMDETFSEDLQKMTYVTSVISYANTVGKEIPTNLLTNAQYEQFFSKNYSRIVVISSLDVEGAAVFELIDKIRGTAQSYYGDSYHLLGESVSTYDMKVIISKDNKVVTWLAILGIGLIILFTFRNLLLPIVMVLVIESAIWINLSVPYFMETQLVYIAYLILSSIQLGATVDYAILYSDRYMDFRKTLGKKEAIIHTTQATMTSIITSASILGIAGFCLGLVSTNYAISQIGILIGRGALLSAGAVLFALPALLHIFDFPIQKLSFKSRKEEVS